MGRDERRRSERLREGLSVLFVRNLGGTDIGTGVLRDLSATGASVLTEDPIELDADLYVGLFLHGRENPLIARTRVVRVEAQSTHRYVVGLAFCQAGAAQHHALVTLADYLAKRRRERFGNANPTRTVLAPR